MSNNWGFLIALVGLISTVITLLINYLTKTRKLKSGERRDIIRALQQDLKEERKKTEEYFREEIRKLNTQITEMQEKMKKSDARILQLETDNQRLTEERDNIQFKFEQFKSSVREDVKNINNP